MIRVAGIVEESIVDGKGLRYVVFTQGCPHRCKGCHNPETHDFSGGSMMSAEQMLAQIDQNPLLDGITISGGEPMEQSSELIELAAGARARGLSVILYSGYTFEQILSSPKMASLLPHVDTLIDGKYEQDKRSLELEFKGSSNQRTIDVQLSLKEGRAVLQ